jgi:hypothetical protein
MTGNPSLDEWYRAHRQEFKEDIGEWIAYSKGEVISHDRDYLIIIGRVELEPLEYIIERISIDK